MSGHFRTTIDVSLKLEMAPAYCLNEGQVTSFEFQDSNSVVLPHVWVLIRLARLLTILLAIFKGNARVAKERCNRRTWRHLCLDTTAINYAAFMWEWCRWFRVIAEKIMINMNECDTYSIPESSPSTTRLLCVNTAPDSPLGLILMTPPLPPETTRLVWWKLLSAVRARSL